MTFLTTNVLPVYELAHASWAQPQAAHAALRKPRCYAHQPFLPSNLFNPHQPDRVNGEGPSGLLDLITACEYEPLSTR